MNITLNQGFHFSIVVARIIADASGQTYTHPTWDKYYLGGNVYKNTGDLCRAMLKEINGWMIDSGLVDVEKLRKAHGSHGYIYFTIS